MSVKYAPLAQYKSKVREERLTMFSKYDVYTTVQSIYCYPDTDMF